MGNEIVECAKFLFTLPRNLESHRQGAIHIEAHQVFTISPEISSNIPLTHAEKHAYNLRLATCGLRLATITIA
ncbi:MAG: hypothetical protein IJP89_05190 [Synergistaceae bacterium]|nr:hypothetical protein [Synergistaceae bacterium]MBR0257056.1 hypothetical protein [Synergistaceae bacterium]